MSKQICELKTSIQAYAAARAYDLPDLMRLAEAKIDKYGEGLPLPSLLEVARDAYPTLTEGDGWFLDYLRSRIRPHLRDPKLLLGSNLLDQISSILSPHRVLLRTVLELFCERLVLRPEPATPLAASTIASPITSPASSRPVSPLPQASPPSLVEARLKSTAQYGVVSTRKNPRATPWPSPDNISEASWVRSTSPEPPLPEPATPRFDATPLPGPIPVLEQFPELGPVIIDVVPPPGPSIGARAVVEPQLKLAPESEVGAGAPVGTAAFEADGQTRTVVETVPAAQREEEDPGKDVDREPPSKELEPIPEVVPEIVPEIETEHCPQPKAHRPVIREADSGFWEAPDFEPRKERARSLMELDPMPAVTVESTAELELTASSSQVPGTDTRDFAASDADAGNKTDPQARATETPQELGSVPLSGGDGSDLDVSAEDGPKRTVKPESVPEPVPIQSVEGAPEKVAGALGFVMPENPADDESVETGRDIEVEAHPDITVKVEPLARHQEQESLLTILQAPEATEEFEEVAKPEPKPEPEANPPDPVHLSDIPEPARATEPKAAQPGVESEPEPAGKFEVQRVNIDPAIHSGLRESDPAEPTAVLGAKPTPEQEGARTEADDRGVQPCSAQVRQRSWKKRFMSLRYPALGRGM